MLFSSNEAGVFFYFLYEAFTLCQTHVKMKNAKSQFKHNFICRQRPAARFGYIRNI